MELSRTEYPAIANAVAPTPAVKLIRDRLQKGQTLNNEIAEWLQERRKAEDAYVLALTKLCRRACPGDNSELGIFAAPWAKIVEATSTIATSHHHFAEKVEAEVERPIREFVTRNVDWSSMKGLEINLGAVAKSIDSAEERAEKLRKRGPKAKPQHVAESATAVSNAHSEWDSQAPYVFEKLQAADESRCNNLRDALTRLQTLELDQTQSSMQAVEATLGIMLDISTSEEMRMFADKATSGRQPIERRQSRTSSRAPGNPSTPSIVTDDSVSVQSTGSGGPSTPGGPGAPAHSGLGLKRLGTVLRNRNRNSMFHRSASPASEKRFGDRYGKGHPPLPSPKRSDSENNNGLTVPSPCSLPAISDEIERSAATLIQEQNGTHRPTSSPKPDAESFPLAGTPSLTVTSEEPRTDSEGYSIPPPSHENSAAAAISEAEDHQPQFKVEIKNDVIREEEEEADAALSKVANTLRAHNTVSRKTRGRRDARDVRNTMYIANPPDITDVFAGSPPLTPMKVTPRASNVASEAGSDTQSIKSSRSVTSLSAAVIKHPDLTEHGLSASLIEVVSASFEGGVLEKTLVTGEIALAFVNAVEPAEVPISIPIRMENFSVLEKVAPNPAFVSAIPDRAGEYSVAVQGIRKTAVAFKYQVHVDELNASALPPIIVSTVWRVEAHQSSVIVNWKPNPNCKRLSENKAAFTLRNVVFVVGIEGVTTSSCQSKPVGTFSRDKGRIAWRHGELQIDPALVESSGGKMLARFSTNGQARPTSVEVRWELTGDDADTMGSGLALTALDPTKPTDNDDPFADASGEEKAETSSTWNMVPTVKRIISGKYASH